MPSTGSRRSSRQASGDSIVIEAAWLYYNDGLNQNDIADRLQVSRATVVNYLQEARESGFVRISLAPDVFTGHETAIRLRETFGLEGAYVLPEGRTPDENAMRVTTGAARWLPGLLAPGDRLGVAWGKTIHDVAECIEPVAIPSLTVLQLVGSMATPYGFSADVCSSYVARRLSARCVNLHVPAILSDQAIAALLRSEALIARQFEEIENFNKTLFAVGSATPDSHIVSSGVATAGELQWYVERGAVGVVCGRFIGSKGEPIEGPLDGRVMGVALDRMRHPQTGILVSVGPDRVAATAAALRGGYATHLVTHQASAEAILASGR